MISPTLVAHERLVTFLQLALQTGKQHGSSLGILSGLFLITAQHITPAAQCDVFDLELCFAALAWDYERDCHAVVLDHFAANLFGGALTHAKNVVDVCLLKRSDVGCADHATISNHADFADGEMLAQTLNNGRKPRHVTSAVLPGHRKDAKGRSAPSSTMPSTTCLRWGR